MIKLYNRILKLFQPYRLLKAYRVRLLRLISYSHGRASFLAYLLDKLLSRIVRGRWLLSILRCASSVIWFIIFKKLFWEKRLEILILKNTLHNVLHSISLYQPLFIHSFYPILEPHDTSPVREIIYEHSVLFLMSHPTIEEMVGYWCSFRKCWFHLYHLKKNKIFILINIPL